MWVVDSQSLPLSIEMKGGDEHDSKRFIRLTEGIKVNYERGRSKTRPKKVTGDWTYDS